MYPKEMLKLVSHNTNQKVNVINIYNYLYKFSLERLQAFLNNLTLCALFIRYLQLNGFDRVHNNPNMYKHHAAYLEASKNMIEQSSFSVTLHKVVNIDELVQRFNEQNNSNAPAGMGI